MGGRADRADEGEGKSANRNVGSMGQIDLSGLFILRERYLWCRRPSVGVSRILATP